MVNNIRNQSLDLQNKSITKINEWMDNCKSSFSFDNTPEGIHNQDELLLSYLTGIWLLQFHNNKIWIKSSTEIFNKLEELTNKYPQSNTLWEFLHEIFNFLNEEVILDSLLLMEIPNLREALINDTLGTLLQKSLTPDERKRLAANYTTKNSAILLTKILDVKSYSSIIDPFCGSGRLISAYLEGLNIRSQFPHIRIHDLMPSAVLIAYCRLILILSEYNQDLSLIHATIGDAFSTFLSEDSKTLETYDLVLMNPPFTRTHRINRSQRKNLLKIEKCYGKYLSGQVGLHIYAILLADLLMKKNGLLGAVLPASTVLSQYSRGVHEFLLNKYQVKTIASSKDEKSYSEDSNLREIVLIARKTIENKGEKIQFLRLNSCNKTKGYISSSQLIPKKVLSKEWNWTIFLKDPELLKIRNLLLQSGFIKNGNELELEIVRGLEMYGPDFFFIPNRKWKIISELEDEILLKNDRNIIRVPKKFLVRSLRKPGKYNQKISPKVSDFALSVPNSETLSQTWMRNYLDVSEKYASPAKRTFGQDWISHINNQVQTKKPWGHLFLIDKFGISSTSTMAHFFDAKLSCSKNFYVFRNCPAPQAKLHAAWLNSSIFIVLFLLTRREIGGSYGRLQIIDYMKEPLFFDILRYEPAIKTQIIVHFDAMRKINLPPIPEQLQNPKRRALDHSVIQGLNLERETEKSLLIDIYALLERIFKNLKRRNNVQRVKK